MERSNQETSNPRKGAGLLSTIFMAWMYRIINVGRKRELTGDDLYSLMQEDQARNIVNDAEYCWADEIKSATISRKKPKLWRALLKMFSSKDILTIVVTRFVNSACTLVLAVIVWYFLKVLNESHINYNQSIPFVVGIAVAGFMKSITSHQNALRGEVKGMHLKVAIMGLVYKKILSTRRSELSNFTTGHIINLLSNDAETMDETIERFIMAITFPIEIIVSIIMLWWLVGWQSLSGVLYFVVLLIYNFIATQKFGTLRSKAARATDKRLATINSIICGIRAVKMYAWEWNFRDLVKSLRRYLAPFEFEFDKHLNYTTFFFFHSKEMKFIRIRSLITSSFIASYNTATPAALLISVLSLLYTGIHLTSFRVFTLVVLLNISRFAICDGLSDALLYVIDAKVAVQRVEQFLLWFEKTCGETPKTNASFAFSFNNFGFEKSIICDKKLSNVLRVDSWKKSKPLLIGMKRLEAKHEHGLTTSSCLKIENVCASWSRVDNITVLQDVSIQVPPEQIIVITGPVGSGKSSLLLAILGELSLQTGSIIGRGNIAYVSQIPWVFSGTIRDNILFGKPLMSEKYQKVLEICDLQTDLQCFSKGDLSFIGQKGVCLSGGQRARVSLARAVYSDADVFLLDDPLSAVDAKVGKVLFEKCICEVLDRKMRILVTHQLQYLEKVDQIVFLKEGQVEFSGSYDQFKDTQISRIIWNENYFNTENPQESHGISSHSKNPTTCTLDSSYQEVADDEEEKIIGTVNWKVYWSFFRAGLPAIGIVLFMAIHVFDPYLVQIQGEGLVHIAK